MSATTRAKYGSAALSAMTKQTADNKAALALQKSNDTELIAANIRHVEEFGINLDAYDDRNPEGLAASVGEAAYQKGRADAAQAANFNRAKTLLDSAVPSVNYDALGNAVVGEDPIEAIVAGFKPPKNTHDFDRAQATFEKIEAYADTIREERRTEPAKAATRFPEVKGLMTALADLPPAQRTPQHYQDLVRAMLETQASFGIAPANRDPLPPAMSAQIGFMMSTTIPERVKGNREEFNVSVRDLFNRIERDYGEYADEVIAQAMTDSKTSKDTTNLLAGLMKKVMAGKPITAADRAALVGSAETDAQEGFSFSRFLFGGGEPATSYFPGFNLGGRSQPDGDPLDEGFDEGTFLRGFAKLQAEGDEVATEEFKADAVLEYGEEAVNRALKRLK